MNFHHIGVVTISSLDSEAFYESLGYEVTRRVTDPIQNAKISLLEKAHHPRIELIEPIDSSSPAASWGQKLITGPYHTCYEVESLDEAVETLVPQRLKVVLGPVPAPLFEGRRVVFLWGKVSGLIELVESARSG